MAWSHTQSKLGADGNATLISSYAITFTSVVSSNALVCGVVQFSGGSAVTSVTDDKSNTYTIADAVADIPGASGQTTFYKEGISNNPQTVTVHWASATSNFVRGVISEYAGIATSSAIDGHNGNLSQVSSATFTTPSITTTGNGDLIYSGYSQAASGSLNWTAAGGATIRGNSVSGDSVGVAAEDQLQTTAGAITASITQSAATAENYSSIMAFKIAAATGNPFVSKVIDLPPIGYVYSEWQRWTHIANTNLPKSTILPQPLSVQSDWPNPVSVLRSPDYTWIQRSNVLPTPTILTTTLRTQVTTSNPINYIRLLDYGWSQNLLETTLGNINVPFKQLDWPNPRYITWDRFWAQSPAQTQIQVISEFNWQLVPGPQYLTPSLTSSGLSLTTVVQNPFNQNDWPLPKIYQPLLQTWSQSLNLFYQSEIFPFVQTDYPNPQRITWYKDWSLNLLQNTLQPAFQAPFNQFDWPLPRTHQPIQQFWSESGNVQLPFPTPFFQNIDANTPVIVQPIDATWLQNLSEFLQSNTFPFSQTDWKSPYPVYWYEDYNQNLVVYLPVGIKPFNQSYWPLTGSLQPIDQFYYQALALNLPTPPSPIVILSSGKQLTEQDVLRSWMKAIGNKGRIVRYG